MHTLGDISKVEGSPPSGLGYREPPVCIVTKLLPVSLVGSLGPAGFQAGLDEDGQEDQHKHRGPEGQGDPRQLFLPLWAGLHQVAGGEEVVGEQRQEGEEELAAVRELYPEGVFDPREGEVWSQPRRQVRGTDNSST